MCNISNRVQHRQTETKWERGEEEERKKGRLRQLFTTKGWTHMFLAGLVWVRLICFGQTILDPLVWRLCVADLAMSCSGPLGSVVASAGLTQPRGSEDQRDVAQNGRNSFQRNRRGQGLQSFPYGGSDHFKCQTALPLSRPHLHSGQRK